MSVPTDLLAPNRAVAVARSMEGALADRYEVDTYRSHLVASLRVDPIVSAGSLWLTGSPHIVACARRAGLLIDPAGHQVASD